MLFEISIARRLGSHLEDDYVCWYNVPVGAWNQHPDLLILHPRRGLLVIEVKDWKLENIRSMYRLTATLQVDGREVRKSNPLDDPGYRAQYLAQTLANRLAIR